MGKVKEGLYNDLLEDMKQPWEMCPRLSYFLAIPVFSISKGSPKKIEDIKVLKGISPSGLGSPGILFCNLGYNSPSDFGGRTVALIRTKKSDAGSVAQMQRG